MADLFIPTHRAPTTPGDMLLMEFLRPLGVSQLKFAKQIGVGYPRLNEIINGKRAVTPDTAMRFAKALETSPQFWLNAQLATDLCNAQHSRAAKAIAKIKPLPELARAS
jgi:addiction module HigA family antidote